MAVLSFILSVPDFYMNEREIGTYRLTTGYRFFHRGNARLAIYYIKLETEKGKLNFLVLPLTCFSLYPNLWSQKFYIWKKYI
jgi:hypothetical protein